MFLTRPRYVITACGEGGSISVPGQHVRAGRRQRVPGMPSQQRDRQYRLHDLPVQGRLREQRHHRKEPRLHAYAVLPRPAQARRECREAATDASPPTLRCTAVRARQHARRAPTRLPARLRAPVCTRQPVRPGRLLRDARH